MINYLKELKQSDEFEYNEGAKFIEKSLGICFPKAYFEDFLSLGLED